MLLFYVKRYWPTGKMCGSFLCILFKILFQSMVLQLRISREIVFVSTEQSDENVHTIFLSFVWVLFNIYFKKFININCQWTRRLVEKGLFLGKIKRQSQGGKEKTWKTLKYNCEKVHYKRKQTVDYFNEYSKKTK